MTVALVENGEIKQVWHDVKTLVDLGTKYGLSGLGYQDISDAIAGQLEQGDGSFAAPPPHIPTSAEIENQVQTNTDDILQNDKKFRVITELIFDTLKAGKTGNYSAFDGVVDRATFRDHVVARFRALN